MESSSLDGFKRDEATGLWVPDLTTDGLNALKEKEVLDPKKFADKDCMFCNGIGEMRRTTQGDRFKWVICMCVVKRFPGGKTPWNKSLTWTLKSKRGKTNDHVLYK